MNSSKNTQQTDPIDLIRRYLKIIWKRKFWILLIFIFITAAWTVFYSMFLKKSAVYTAYAIIKFDDPRSNRRIDAVTDFAETQTEAKVAILQTRSFLEKVVDSLDMNIIVNTPGVNRFKLFKKINYDMQAKYGDYKLLNVGNRVDVYYKNDKDKVKNIQINTFELPADSVFNLSMNGLHIKFNTNYLKSLPQVEFSFVEKSVIINAVRNKLEMRLDRSRTILTLGYKSTVPKLAALVINTIANYFVDQLLEYKKYTTTSVLKSFEEQLQAARKELDKSEEELRRFREQNPYLMLTDGGANIVRNLSAQQTELDAVDNSSTRLSSLIQQKNKGTSQDRDLVYSEILSVLEAQNLSGIHVLADKFRDLTDEKARLLADNYSPQHPQVVEIENNISDLQREIDSRASSFIEELEKRKDNLQSEISTNQRDLRRLPRGELRLAELQRDRTVKESIYSNILVRYNEAKVSDAAIMPDAFLIEEADIPSVEQTGVSGSLKRLLFGPFLGLAFGIGLFILLDFMDKTVKDAKEVSAKLNLPVLASIPVINDEKEIPDDLNPERKVDSKLITSSYAPHLAGESFRVLRTKAMMNIKSENIAFLVASLNPNEGKSLVASNVAITFAQQKIPTVLLDCDLRRGVLHNSFSCSKKPGLTDILVGNSPIQMSEISKMIQQTHIPNLFLISNGIQVPNPSELLGGNRMREVFEVLKREFGAIIFDTPPIEFIPDALVLNNFVHNIIFVVRYGKTNLAKIREKIKEFPTAKADLMGVVINAHQDMVEKKYDAYSYYHY